MAEIVINDDRYAKGKLSITRKQIDTGKVAVVGLFTTHRYFEEITQLETYRYILKGVEVYQEDFGSDDHQIAYSFTAKELIIKGIDSACESLFTPEEVEEIEDKLYPGVDINKRGDSNGGDKGTN